MPHMLQIETLPIHGVASQKHLFALELRKRSGSWKKSTLSIYGPHLMFISFLDTSSDIENSQIILDLYRELMDSEIHKKNMYLTRNIACKSYSIAL